MSAFNSTEFALEVRLAMARRNLSFRMAGSEMGVDQATLHRIAVKEREPSVTTYFAVRRWLDSEKGAPA